MITEGSSLHLKPDQASLELDERNPGPRGRHDSSLHLKPDQASLELDERTQALAVRHDHGRFESPLKTRSGFIRVR